MGAPTAVTERVRETCEISIPGPSGLRTIFVSHPDKVYFPSLGVTKLEVVRYFLSVGEGILDSLRERPTTLERWPGGVVPGAKLTVYNGRRGQAFYQRRVPRRAPGWIKTVPIASPEGPPSDVVTPTELAVVAWAANLGTLTFHPWPVRGNDVLHPDRLQIDLDPQPGTSFNDAVEVAFELRGLLEEAGMMGWPKTSGGRGVHVYVPIEPRWSFAEARRALTVLGHELERRMPNRVTLSRRKADRGARVYFDYNQMAGTVASPYSIRPTPLGRVSAPLTWTELSTMAPEDFDVTTMPARFAEVGDVHADLPGHCFSLELLLETAAHSDHG